MQAEPDFFFDFLWQWLDELTTSHMKEVRRHPVVAREEEPQGLGPDPNELKSKTRRRKGGRSLKCFSDWIKEEPIEEWSLLHDTYGACYGIMTMNLAAVYN